MKTLVIKRYASRKLYDMENSVYITLKDIINLTVAQKEFIVIDNRSKRDITTETTFNAFCGDADTAKKKDIINHFFTKVIKK